MLAYWSRPGFLAAAVLAACLVTSAMPEVAQAQQPAKKKPAVKAAAKPSRIAKPAVPMPPPPPPAVELIGHILMPPDALRPGPASGQFDGEGLRGRRGEAQLVVVAAGRRECAAQCGVVPGQHGAGGQRVHDRDIPPFLRRRQPQHHAHQLALALEGGFRFRTDRSGAWIDFDAAIATLHLTQAPASLKQVSRADSPTRIEWVKRAPYRGDHAPTLAVPTTYMNESGQAVGPLVRRHGIDGPHVDEKRAVGGGPGDKRDRLAIRRP